MQAKKVKDVMHQGVISCPIGTPIPEVARKIVKHDVSAIVITDQEGYLAGLIARTDLVVLYGYQEMWPHMLAEHVMITQVKTISPEAMTVEAAQAMTENKFHRLIVTETGAEAKEKPIGVISMTDIVQHMALA